MAGTNEAFSRVKIDAQLKDQGWEVLNTNAVRFEYVDDSGPAAAVANAWQNRERLPSLMRLQWSRAPGSQPQGLTVAARRSAHPLCAAQLATMPCGAAP